MSLLASLTSAPRLLAAPLLLAAGGLPQSPQSTFPDAPLTTGTPLPEPLTWTLIGIAAIGAAFAARRKRHGCA